jgi:hypothetical protein
MRGLSVWVGFKQTGVPYRRDAREAGVTKYPFRKMVRFALRCHYQFFVFAIGNSQAEYTADS